MNPPLRVGALFAGYGGLELALGLVLDVELAWVVEYDRGPSAILAANFPGVPNYGDVTSVDWTQVPPIDVLTGGSPCQDLSTAGKRAGMKPGTRSGLWAAMTRAIDELRPELVVWENVMGALNAPAASDLEHDEGRLGDESGRAVLLALGRVLGDLAVLGYDAGWTCVRASDVGAPHRRARVFVVARPAASADAGR